MSIQDNEMIDRMNAEKGLLAEVEIKKAIYSTLVIGNPDSWDWCWKKLKPILSEVCKRQKKKHLDLLKEFYESGNMTGYSNQELSRIQSCIDKIENAPEP